MVTGEVRDDSELVDVLKTFTKLESLILAHCPPDSGGSDLEDSDMSQEELEDLENIEDFEEDDEAILNGIIAAVADEPPVAEEILVQGEMELGWRRRMDATSILNHALPHLKGLKHVYFQRVKFTEVPSGDWQGSLHSLCLDRVKPTLPILAWLLSGATRLSQLSLVCPEDTEDPQEIVQVVTKHGLTLKSLSLVQPWSSNQTSRGFQVFSSSSPPPEMAQHILPLCPNLETLLLQEVTFQSADFPELPSLRKLAITVEDVVAAHNFLQTMHFPALTDLRYRLWTHRDPRETAQLQRETQGQGLRFEEVCAGLYGESDIDSHCMREFGARCPDSLVS